MNLFAVGWGLARPRTERVVRELRRTSLLYAHLDHESLWYRELPGGVIVGAVSSPSAVSAPRIYVHHGPASTTLFDGLPIDLTGTIAGHRADELDAHWSGLSDRLEGRFCAVRVSTEPPAIELINDPIGVAQVYFAEMDGGSLVSNSAGLVQRVAGTTRLDALGASMFLVLDWVGADRTLRDDVRVAAGAQHWTWRLGETSWAKRRYWSPPTRSRPVRIVDKPLIDEVVGPVGQMCSQAARINGYLNAPISGGKDSRMLASVLMHEKIPARYWTKGDPGSLDLTIGRALAARYSLPHRVANRPTQVAGERDPTADVAGEWQTLSRRFVLQNDGLASLYLIGNIQGEPDRVDQLAVTLSGMCAESARGGLYDRGHSVEPGISAARAIAHLAYRACGHPRALVRMDAYRLARASIHDTLTRAVDDGVAQDNLPTQLYLDERCRRWATNNPRELAQTEDKVLPFLTRPFVASALSIRPDERLTERLHYEVIRAMVPGLESDPPLDQPWEDHLEPMTTSRRVRNRIMPDVPAAVLRGLVRVSDALRPPHVIRTAFSPYDEASWLEANLGFAREMCLSHHDSELWSFIDRRTLERLLADRTPPMQRRLFQYPLFAAMTMFQYEHLEQVELADAG